MTADVASSPPTLAPSPPAPARAPDADAAPRAARLDALDWLRGLAVVLMIQTHLYDSWVSPAAKATRAYWWTRYWGGVPSRLFLLLVGVSLAIRFEGQLRKGVSRATMVGGAVRRGLEILALAYLFRFQEYALSGFWGPPDDLARVDILNCIGVSMILVAVVAAPRAGRRQSLVALAAAALLLGLGPVLGPAHYPSVIPRPISSYLGGQRPMSWFGLFPWGAWAFTGLAVGHVWARAGADPNRAARVYLLTGLAGLALMAAVVLVRKMNPYVIRYPSELVQQMGPGTFFYRLGLCGLLALLAYAASRLVTGRFSMMRQLGRTSLLVYWVHVDLCYGVISKPLHGRLGMGAATIGFVLMTAAMLLVSLGKTRYWEPWRRRQAARAAAAPSTAQPA